jgi:hypothetical protein
MSASHSLRVECYAGYRGEETPRRFFIGRERIEVTHVDDAWLSPDHRYFKVSGSDGFTYLLRHDVHSRVWSLAGKPGSAPRDVN